MAHLSLKRISPLDKYRGNTLFRLWLRNLLLLTLTFYAGDYFYPLVDKYRVLGLCYRVSEPCNRLV